MKIAVDAMGGDHAPGEIVQGALDAVAGLGIEVVLVGEAAAIQAELDRRGGRRPGVTVQHAAEVITTHEEPAMAFRRKKDSSIAVAYRLVRDGAADAVLSAGSTGALLVAGKVLFRALPGVERPGLLAPLPTRAGRPVLVIDVGANVDSKPEHLVQWAVMTSVYAEAVLGRERPRVGLVNIGSEDEKGNALTRATLSLLRQVAGLNFTGYVEPRDVPMGAVDVAVVDGFAGNVLLKTYEGVAAALFAMIRAALTSSPLAALGGLLARPALRRLARQVDYAEVGAVPLLGLRHPAFKCHGSSRARAIYNGLRVAREFVQNRTIERLQTQIARLEQAPGQGEDAADHG